MKNLFDIKSFGVRFRRDESGAVTIDYVVITAAIVGLSIAVLSSVSVGAVDLAADVGDTVAKFELWGEDTGGPPRE